MERELRTSLREQALAEKRNRYSTHPSAEERIANVRRLNAPGVFALDGPAERLFRDFAALCASVTERHYQSTLGTVPNELVRVDADTVHAGDEEERSYEKARESLLPNARFVNRWLIPKQGQGTGEIDEERYGDLLLKLFNQEGGVGLIEAGGRIAPTAFYLEGNELEGTLAEVAVTRNELAHCVEELQGAAADVADRIWRIPPDVHRTAYEAICGEADALLALRVIVMRRRILRSNISSLPAAGAANALDENRQHMDALRTGILRRLDAVESTVPFGGQTGSLASQLCIDGDSEEAAEWLLERADLISTRLLNRLCWQTTNP